MFLDKLIAEYEDKIFSHQRNQLVIDLEFNSWVILLTKYERIPNNYWVIHFSKINDAGTVDKYFKHLTERFKNYKQ